MSTQTRGQPLSRLIGHFFVVFLVSLFMVVAACGGDSKKNNKVPVPVLTSVSPTSVTAGAAAFTLTVNGLYFVAGSTVNWNGAARATTFVSGSRLTAAIQAADVASAGTAQVTVVNPAPGGGTSSSVTFTIENVAPVAATLSPANIIAGSAAFDLTVSGSGFVSGSTVHWNGSARPTTFVSSSALKAAIAATDVAVAGTAQVRVVNPPPGNGTSSALTFAVQNAAPVIASLAPSSVRAGSVGFDLTVTGTGFVQGATVQWGGANRATTYSSSTQLIAAIPATDVSIAGTVRRGREESRADHRAQQRIAVRHQQPESTAGRFPGAHYCCPGRLAAERAERQRWHGLGWKATSSSRRRPPTWSQATRTARMTCSCGKRATR